MKTVPALVFMGTARPVPPAGTPGLIRSAPQRVEALLDDAVTTATGPFQAWAVEDAEVSTVIVDQPRLLERASGFRHAGQANRQDVRHELLRKRQPVRADPVLRHE